MDVSPRRAYFMHAKPIKHDSRPMTADHSRRSTQRPVRPVNIE